MKLPEAVGRCMLKNWSNATMSIKPLRKPAPGSAGFAVLVLSEDREANDNRLHGQIDVRRAMAF